MILLRRASFLIMLAALAACGSGGSDGTDNMPGFTFVIAAGSGSGVQGSVATITGTVARTGGYTGDVQVQVTGAPTGATVTNTISPTGTDLFSVTMNITIGASVLAGHYPITITASGPNASSVTRTFTLTVAAGSGVGAGSFSASVNGTPFTALFTFASRPVPSAVAISGSAGTQGFQLTLFATTTGTVLIGAGDNSPSSAIYVDSTSAGGCGWDSVATGGSGSVIITALDASHVAGTFTFTATSVVGPGCTAKPPVVVTNGVFNVNF